MKTFKKLVAMACFISMTLGAATSAKAALKEKDIIWIGARQNSSSRISGIYGDVEAVYGKNVVYSSAANKKYQIYFGATGEKTGFKYKDVTALAGGKLYYVTTNRNSYKGMIIDEDENEIYSGLRNIADEVTATYRDGVVNKGIENDRFICCETKEGLVILDTKRDCKIIRKYKGYELDSFKEIYQNKVDYRRHIRIIDKAKGKLGFLWLSQKSGVSEIIAKKSLQI